MRHIEIARSAVQVIEISGRRRSFFTPWAVQAFGERVRAQERESPGEPFFEFCLKAVVSARSAPLLQEKDSPLRIRAARLHIPGAGQRHVRIRSVLEARALVRHITGFDRHAVSDLVLYIKI